MRSWVKVFFAFYAILLIWTGVSFFWRHPFLMTAGGCVAVWIAVLRQREKTRRRVEGYWIEYVCEGLLRGEKGEFALVYHDRRGDLWFTGIGAVQFPSPAEWETKYPEWAVAEREIIIDRIRKRYGRLCSPS